MATTDPLNPEKLPGNQPINTTAPLTGGGQLTTDRTFAYGLNMCGLKLRLTE